MGNKLIIYYLSRVLSKKMANDVGNTNIHNDIRRQGHVKKENKSRDREAV